MLGIVSSDISNLHVSYLLALTDIPQIAKIHDIGIFSDIQIT